MTQNKKSIWSVIILIAAILTLAVLVAGIVVTVVDLPSTLEAAKQAAINEGASASDVDIAVSFALGVTIALLPFHGLAGILRIYVLKNYINKSFKCVALLWHRVL